MSTRFNALFGCIKSLEFIGTSDRLLLVSGGSDTECDHPEQQPNNDEEKKEITIGTSIKVKDDRG